MKKVERVIISHRVQTNTTCVNKSDSIKDKIRLYAAKRSISMLAIAKPPDDLEDISHEDY